MIKASIPSVKPGFFLARRERGKRWVYADFPIRDKAYYLNDGWEEVSRAVAEAESLPIVAPIVEPPERLASIQTPKPATNPRGRPKQAKK